MILSTSGKKRMRNTILWYTVATIFCVAFTNIYAVFGHGVSSQYMTYMFLYPLVGGAILLAVMLIQQKSQKEHAYHRASYNLYNSAIASFTIGSMLQGIFEIAGTNSGFITVYYIAGFVLILLSIVFLLTKRKKVSKNYHKERVQA